MSTFRVTSEELASAGGAVRRSVGDLAGALATLRGSAGAAAGTPAAAAHEALVADAGQITEGLHVAVDDLGQCLGRAASVYAGTEQGVAACYAPGK